MIYTIELTDTEDKALKCVCANAQEWIENMVKNRCRIAIEDIVTRETSRMIADPNTTSIPASREEIVAAYVPPVEQNSL